MGRVAARTLHASTCGHFRSTIDIIQKKLSSCTSWLASCEGHCRPFDNKKQIKCAAIACNSSSSEVLSRFEFQSADSGTMNFKVFFVNI